MLTTESTVAWLRAFDAAVTHNEELLTGLDAAVGDADHGSNLRRGMAAVVEDLEHASAATIGAALCGAGMTLVRTVGGASGPLYGTLFIRMGQSSGETSELTPAGLVLSLRAGLEGVQARGRTELGDKTMVDVLAPAIDAMDAALATGASLASAVSTAARAAQFARDSTAVLVARKGRASYLGDRSSGHIDPGGASAALLITALASALAADAEAVPA